MKYAAIYFLFFFMLQSCNNKDNAHQRHAASSKTGMTDMSSTKASEGQTIVNIDSKSAISNAELIAPITKEIRHMTTLPGYIAFDERRNNKIVVRFSGRIDKLYVKADYQYVNKGDKILELYSPEINAFQEEYLHHLKTKSDSFLIDATRTKLLLLGLTENQVQAIEKSGVVLKYITIYSNYTGYIIYDQSAEMGNNTVISESVPGGMDMASQAQNQNINISSSGTRIREGDYINKGQTLFILNDCRYVYAMFALPANTSASVKTGQVIRIKSPLLDKTVGGKVDFIEPAFKSGQKFVQVRSYLSNAGLQLKVNSTISGEIEETGNYPAIPATSILSLGKRKFVWEKTGYTGNGSRILRPQEIHTGREANGYIQVVDGLSPTDSIAKDAGYILDSESLIDATP